MSNNSTKCKRINPKRISEEEKNDGPIKRIKLRRNDISLYVVKGDNKINEPLPQRIQHHKINNSFDESILFANMNPKVVLHRFKIKIFQKCCQISTPNSNIFKELLTVAEIPITINSATQTDGENLVSFSKIQNALASILDRKVTIDIGTQTEKRVDRKKTRIKKSRIKKQIQKTDFSQQTESKVSSHVPSCPVILPNATSPTAEQTIENLKRTIDAREKTIEEQIQTLSILKSNLLKANLKLSEITINGHDEPKEKLVDTFLSPPKTAPRISQNSSTVVLSENVNSQQNSPFRPIRRQYIPPQQPLDKVTYRTQRRAATIAPQNFVESAQNLNLLRETRYSQSGATTTSTTTNVSQKVPEINLSELPMANSNNGISISASSKTVIPYQQIQRRKKFTPTLASKANTKLWSNQSCDTNQTNQLLQSMPHSRFLHQQPAPYFQQDLQVCQQSTTDAANIRNLNHQQKAQIQEQTHIRQQLPQLPQLSQMPHQSPLFQMQQSQKQPSHKQSSQRNQQTYHNHATPNMQTNTASPQFQYQKLPHFPSHRPINRTLQECSIHQGQLHSNPYPSVQQVVSYQQQMGETESPTNSTQQQYQRLFHQNQYQSLEYVPQSTASEQNSPQQIEEQALQIYSNRILQRPRVTVIQKRAEVQNQLLPNQHSLEALQKQRNTQATEVWKQQILQNRRNLQKEKALLNQKALWNQEVQRIQQTDKNCLNQLEHRSAGTFILTQQHVSSENEFSDNQKTQKKDQQMQVSLQMQIGAVEESELQEEDQQQNELLTEVPNGNRQSNTICFFCLICREEASLICEKCHNYACCSGSCYQKLILKHEQECIAPKMIQTYKMKIE